MRRLSRAIVAVALGALACSDVTAPFVRDSETAASPPPHGASSVPHAASPSDLTLDAALELLRVTRTFESPQIGYAGAESDLAAAWRVVERSPGGREAFRVLYDSAVSAEGRLYALLGLFATDPEEARRKGADPSWEHIQVQTFFGCIVGPLPARPLIINLAHPDWVEWYRVGTTRPPRDQSVQLAGDQRIAAAAPPLILESPTTERTR